MAAVAKIKAEARARLAQDNWGKAIAILFALCCLPLVFLFCLEIFTLLLHRDSLSSLVMEAGTVEEYLALVQSRFLSGDLTAYLLTLAGIVLAVMLLTLPLSLGARRWQLLAARGEKPPASEFFYYFTSLRRYCRSVWCAVNLAARKLFWFLVCFLPGAAALVYFSVILAEREGGRITMTTGVGIAAGLVLLAAGLIAYVCLLIRYFAAKYAVAAYEDCPAGRAISRSVRRMKGRRGAAFLLAASFFPWGLLCFFVIPILYVQPYFRMSLAVCSKWILDESVEARRAEILMPVPFEDASAPRTAED